MVPISKGSKGKKWVNKKGTEKHIWIQSEGFKKTLYCTSKVKASASQSGFTHSWKNNEKLFKKLKNPDDFSNFSRVANPWNIITE